MPTRRDLLRTGIAGGVAGLAGCPGAFTGGPDIGTGGAGPAGTPVASEPAEGSAPTFQYDGGARGWAAGSPPTESVAVAWRQILSPVTAGHPAVTADSVYELSGTGLVALRRAAGGVRWRADVGSVTGMPAVHGDTVFVLPRTQGTRRELQARSTDDGSLSWSVPVGEAEWVTAADDRLFVGGGSETWSVGAVSLDGTAEWHASVAEHASPPAVVDDRVYVAGGDTAAVHAYGTDGTDEWTADLDSEAFAVPTVAPDGTAFVGTHAASVYALDPDGSERWRSEVGSAVRNSLALAAGDLYVPTQDAVVALDTADGSERWRSERASETAVTMADGTVFCGDGRGVFALNAADGSERWSFPVRKRRYMDTMVRGVATPPVPVGERVYVEAVTGEVFALRAGE